MVTRYTVRVISTTGVVHYAFKFGAGVVHPRCNSNTGPYSNNYFKSWKETRKKVSCKNCIKGENK